MEIIRDIYSYEKSACAATIGSFDGVHLGHVAMIAELREAADMAGLPLAVVTFVRHPRLLFDGECEPFLLTAENERLSLLEAAGVERIFLLDFDTCMASMSAERFMHEILAERLGVKLLGVGYDHRFGKPCEGECFECYAKYGNDAGVDVILLSPYSLEGRNISSTMVRRAIAEGDMPAASELLGHLYTISGTVAHGAGIGRYIGYPTANIQPCDDMKLLPPDGVYEVSAVVDGACFKGVMNIGVKPTVSAASLRTVEVHLIGFSGDIYGKDIVVDVVRRIRGEMRFDDISALKRQIKADIASVEKKPLPVIASAIKTFFKIPGVEAFFKISGVVLLLLLAYSALQSVLASLAVIVAFYYGESQGIVDEYAVENVQGGLAFGLPDAAQNLYYGAMSVGLLLSTIIMLLIIHASGLFRLRLSLFRSISRRPLFLSTALVFTSMFVLNIFVQWFPLEDMMQDTFSGISHNVLGALSISLFGPILEEVMFRGAIQGYITRKTGKPILAIIVASLIFGVFHINPIQVVYASLLGMIFGWIYYRTGSLLSVIVGHVLNNTIATLTMLTMSNVDEKAASNASPGYVAFALFAAISIMLVIKLNKSLPPVPVPWHESDESDEVNG